jgi:hypothetical protein
VGCLHRLPFQLSNERLCSSHMRIMVPLIVAATAIAGSAALAQTTTAPNSGAGVPGSPGNKSGPAVRTGSEQGSWIARKQIRACTPKTAQPPITDNEFTYQQLGAVSRVMHDELFDHLVGPRKQGR